MWLRLSRVVEGLREYSIPKEWKILAKVVKVLYAILIMQYAPATITNSSYLSIFFPHFSFLFLNRTQSKRTISLQISLSLSFTLCTSPTIVTATLQYTYIKTYCYEIKKERTRCVVLSMLCVSSFPSYIHTRNFASHLALLRWIWFRFMASWCS